MQLHRCVVHGKEIHQRFECEGYVMTEMKTIKVSGYPLLMLS